jgi:hypothetical protein
VVEDDYDEERDGWQFDPSTPRPVPATSDLRGERAWYVGAVEAASQAVEAAEAQLRQAVAVARSAGATWEDVADALGVVRQSAARRFGRDGV